MCQRLTDAPFSLQLINLNVKHIKHIVTGKIKAHNTQHIGQSVLALRTSFIISYQEATSIQSSFYTSAVCATTADLT